VPTAIGQALLAEGGKDGAHVHHQLRLAMILAESLMVAGTIVAFLGNDVITSVYGAEYKAAADILPAMVAAGIPWAVTSLYLSEVRILHRNVATVAITAALTIGIIGPALVLVPDQQLHGASKAWLAGNIAAAIVAVIAVQITRARNGTDPVLTEAGAEDAAEVGIELADHL
jgi:O-antigen/teichoic acid export membrane protein